MQNHIVYAPLFTAYVKTRMIIVKMGRVLFPYAFLKDFLVLPTLSM